MGIWESMQLAASPAWEFGNPCRWRRRPHGNLGNPCRRRRYLHGNLGIHAGGSITRMGILEIHAGGGVTRMGIWESMRVTAQPAWEVGNTRRCRGHLRGELGIPYEGQLDYRKILGYV